MNDIVHQLPHVNAALNSLATVLLVIGYVLIKQRREIAHRNVMLAAFGTSIVFLASYLTYHFFGEFTKKFPEQYGDTIRYLYYSILLPHVILAATVPFLAVWTIYLGLTNQRSRHNWWAKRTFPIWLFVSITGVMVYVMLYHLYPDTSAAR